MAVGAPPGQKEWGILLKSRIRDSGQKNLIAEVTFRYGALSAPSQHQTFRIAFDNRPEIVGPVVSAWANPNNDFIETGFLLQHIRKTPEKVVVQDLLLDHQALSIKPEVWYTAILEVVGDEALFRMGNNVASAQSEEITRSNNLGSLTLGTTWHEIKRVRIWEAAANPDWSKRKPSILKKRRPYSPAPHNYQSPKKEHLNHAFHQIRFHVAVPLRESPSNPRCVSRCCGETQHPLHHVG